MLPIFVLMDAAAPARPSTFWVQADKLCKSLDTWQAVDDAKLGEAADARFELVKYCRFSVVPPFAARPEASRMAALRAIATAGGVAAEPDTEAEIPARGSSLLVSAAEEQMKKNPSPELGLVGEKVLGAAIGGLCATGDAKTVLPATCALGSSPSLDVFRLAVLRDVVDVFVKRTSESAPQLVRLLALVITHDSLRTATDQLPTLLTPPCTGDACAEVTKSVALASAVTTRLLADGPKLDRDREHYKNILVEEVRTARATAEYTPSAPVVSALDALVESLRQLDDEQRRNVHTSPTAVAEKLLAALKKVALLAALLEAERSNGPAAESPVVKRAEAADAALVVTSKVAAGDVTSAFASSRAALDELSQRGNITAGELRELTAATRLAQARSEDDLKKAARDALLPLPPWIDRWVLDVNVAPPVSKEANGESHTELMGDLTVGYNGDYLGFLAHADSSYYEINETNNFALTERYAGNLDLWGLINVGSMVRLEPRLSGGALYYGTLADDATTTVDRQTNQDSIFGRGVGSLGVRVQPGSRVALYASLGVGGQYEDYFRVLQTSRGDQGTSFNAATTVRYEARFRGQVTIVPRIVSFRARADINAFDMRRSDQAVTYSLGKVTQAEQGVTDVAQLELFARGFIDADVARFFGFVPAIHGGVNGFFLSSNGATTSSVIPVVGIGIRREAL